MADVDGDGRLRVGEPLSDSMSSGASAHEARFCATFCLSRSVNSIEVTCAALASDEKVEARFLPRVLVPSCWSASGE